MSGIYLVDFDLHARRIDVRAGGLDTILAAEANGRTRLVMNLDRLLPYQTKVQGNTIVVSIGSALASAAPAAAAESRPASNRPAASAPGAREIRSVDFRRGGDGMGRLIVNLSDPRTPINLRQQGNSLVLVPNRQTADEETPEDPAQAGNFSNTTVTAVPDERQQLSIAIDARKRSAPNGCSPSTPSRPRRQSPACCSSTPARRTSPRPWSRRHGTA